MATKSALCKEHRNRASLAWLVVSVAIITAGGCSMNNETDVSNESTLDPTAEDARAALLAMVEASTSRELRFLTADLAHEKTVEVDADSIRIGRWYCNLAEHRFVGSLENERLLIEYSGTFTVNERQQWEALITDEVRAETFD